MSPRADGRLASYVGRVTRLPPLTIAAIVAAVVSLALRASIPVSAQAYLLHDDALFTRLARNLANGEWLGPFDNLTLAKGAFYPLFIAAAHALAVPLPLAEQAVYLGAAALAAVALARVTASRDLGLWAFILLALDPTLFHPVLTRVIREGLYMSLCLASIALATLVAFDADRRLTLRRAAVLAGFGLVFAAYWLTREESVWLYPSLLVVAAGGVAIAWRRDGAPWLSRALVVAAQTAIVVAGFATLAGGVAVLNYSSYGVFLSNEFREGTFASAYGAIQRIDAATWSPYLMFDEQVAAHAYAASPAMRELQPAFDGDNGAMWRKIGCDALALAPCPKAYARGWFMWALRDAVQLAGHYKSASDAQAFFRRLADEVNAACDVGRLNCSARRDTLLPPFDWRYAAPWTASLANSLGILAQLRAVETGAPPSTGLPERVVMFADMTGPVAPFVLTGWAASRVCVPRPRVVDTANADIVAVAHYEEAQDVEAHFAKAGATVPATRFRIVTDCRAATCRMVFDGCAPIAPQPLTPSDAEGWLKGTGEVLVRIEQTGNGMNDPVAPSDFIRAPMSVIGALYRLLVPVLLIVGAAGCVAAAVRWRVLAANIPLASVALAAGGAILARAALIAAFDVSSAYSVNPLYLSPAAPFVLLFGVCGAVLGRHALGWRAP